MKKLLLTLVLTFGALVFTTSASFALYIDDGTFVGGLDTFLIGTDSLNNSSPEEEFNWIKDQLINLNEPGAADWSINDFNKINTDENLNPEWLNLYNDSGPSDMLNPDLFAAFDLGYEPDYYAFKIGQGTLSKSAFTEDFLLFRNEDLKQFAVFELQTDDYYIKNVGAISHISTIPEPATMLLLGTGLAGLAGVAVRRRKK